MVPVNRPLRILLVEDNPGDARLMIEALTEAGSSRFALTHVQRLSEGLKSLIDSQYDVILLDLALPDSFGLDTVEQTYAFAREVPIVVLTGSHNEDLGVQAVQAGAQDYLVKGLSDSTQVVRSLRYAIERHRMQEEVRASSLVDELTGLYNRRGFSTLAEQKLKMAQRSGNGIVLLFADMDGLKHINDTLGHKEGDKALCEMANLFRKTFRSTDIVARIGGDEYAVASDETQRITQDVLLRRLKANLDTRNARNHVYFPLSFSIGTVRYDPNTNMTLDEMIARADSLMYADKRARKAGREMKIAD